MPSSNEEKEILEFLKGFKESLQRSIKAGIDISINANVKDLHDLTSELRKLKAEAVAKNAKGLDTQIDKLIGRITKLTSSPNADIETGILDGVNRLTQRIDDVLGENLPKKEAIKQAIDLLQAYRSKAFAIAAAKPHRLPQLEFEADTIAELQATIESLLGADQNTKSLLSLVDNLDFANLSSQQEDKVDRILQLVTQAEKSIGGVVKGTKVIDHAYTDFFEGKNLRERTQDLREATKDTVSAFRSVEVSGRGLSSTLGSLFKFASQAAFTIATENERRRHREGESQVNPLDAKRVHRLITVVGNRVQANFDQIDKVLKLVRSILFPASIALEFLFKGLTESAKATTQIVELFGAQSINFGLDVDPKNFLNRVMDMNEALNASDTDLNVTFQDRLEVFKEFVRSGGTLKTLPFAEQGVFLGSVIHDLQGPVRIAATYENLLGKSLGDIGALLGKYTFESRMSFGQLEDLFGQIASLKTGEKNSPTNVILDSVLEITDRFGNILGGARYNYALLRKVAKRTGLAESQVSQLLSGFLSYAEGIDIDASNKLITLAGYRFDEESDITELRSSLINSLNQVRGSLVEARGNTIRNTQDYSAIQGQIDRLDISKNLVQNVSIQYGITTLARDFPQALMPLILKSVDGQIDLLYGSRADFYKNTIEGFNAALSTVAEPLGLNDEMLQMLIAAKFDKNGKLREGELDVSKLDLGKSLSDADRRRMLKFASETSLSVKTFANQMQQLVDGVKAKFLGLLTRFSYAIMFLPQGSQASSIPAPAPPPKPASSAPTPAAPYIDLGKKVGVSADVLGDRGVLDRVNSLRELATGRVSYTPSGDPKPTKIIDILSDTAKKEKVPLATLMALVAQEKPGNPRYWTTRKEGSANYGIFSTQMGWGGWATEALKQGKAELTDPEKQQIALDPKQVAPVVARQIRGEIASVRSIVSANNWNLTEVQVQALGASLHNLPVIAKVLRNLKSGQATSVPWEANNKPQSFTTLPRNSGEKDFDYIRRNINAFIASAEKAFDQSNTQGNYGGQLTLGSSYFDNILLSIAYAVRQTEESNFESQSTLGLNLTKVADKIAPPPSTPAVRPSAKVAVRPGARAASAAQPLPTGRITAPSPPRIPNSATRVEAAPQLPFGLSYAEIEGGIIGTQVRKADPVPELPYVVNRVVNYEMLYLSSLEEIQAKWKQLYGS